MKATCGSTHPSTACDPSKLRDSSARRQPGMLLGNKQSVLVNLRKTPPMKGNELCMSEPCSGCWPCKLPAGRATKHQPSTRCLFGFVQPPNPSQPKKAKPNPPFSAKTVSEPRGCRVHRSDLAIPRLRRPLLSEQPRLRGDVLQIHEGPLNKLKRTMGDTKQRNNRAKPDGKPQAYL